jgi:hypothetical protein
MLPFIALSLLACTAFAQVPSVCPPEPVPANEQGCAAVLDGAVLLTCPCAMQPIYGCDSQNAASCSTVSIPGLPSQTACLGLCVISSTGWAIIVVSVLIVLAVIIGITCCCCGCSQCCRGGGGTKLVYIANNRQETAEQGAAFLGAQQQQYVPPSASSPGHDFSRDPRFAKVGSA